MVKFWIRDSGNFFSAKSGLTREQISFLQQLKVGDRLVLWREPNSELTLKRYRSSQEIKELT